MLTTAFLVLKMALGGDVAYRVLPFDEIDAEVASGRAVAGLLIHEGQLTYGDEGLQKCLDLGEWWLLETGLPPPRRQHDSARPRRASLRDVSAILRVDRSRASTIVKRRSSTRSVSGAAWTPNAATNSSACT
jgi:hypothetical protein